MARVISHQDRVILRDALSDASFFFTVRGRQTMVRNALGGYPQSGEIEKALRWVNWEGAPAEVAFDLLDKLDGQEPAPGVPALALIAQAIEPMAGTAHREKLRDLRRRMGWGAVDPSSFPAEEWRDHRSAAEVVEERIIGENTLQPMYYLHRALAAADAVVRVDVGGVAKGTGFLVAPDLLITNHHVIEDEAAARSVQACLFDEVADERNKGEFRRKPVTVPAAREKPLLYTSKDLDVSVVRLQGAPQLHRYLPLRRDVVQQNDRVVIIQHPGGFPKQISLQNNLVAHADARIVQYYTSTKAGSSGSPVLDENFAVVAVHHSWVHNPAWDGGGQIRVADPKAVEDLQYRNQGTSVIALLEDLKKTAPDVAAAMTVLSV